MKKNTSRFNRHRVALALAFALAGCGQTPAIIIDDSANFKKHENSIMVPEPSANPRTRNSGWICREAAECVYGDTRAEGRE